MTAAFTLTIPGQDLIDAWSECEMLPPHWSAAQVKQARKCFEQYRQSYVLGIKTPPAKALLWGTADHRAQEVNYRQKIDTREDLPETDVLDAFRDAVEVGIDAAGGLSEVDWAGDTPARGKKELVDDGTRLAALYHKVLAPTVYPIAVEQMHEMLLPGITVPVKMVVDIREEKRIIDTKTTSASKQRVTNENYLQGRIYTAALAQPTYFHLKVKPRDYGGQIKVLDADSKTGDPFVVGATDRSVAQTIRAVRTTLAQIVTCYQTYGPDNPWPDALAHEWACNYCGYRDRGLCSYWSTP